MNDGDPVSVVIVTHNSGRSIIECLESLSKSEYPFDLTIVDNASNDGSIERVKERFPETKIIVNQSNLGYARAANMGLNASSRHFVALLNPDTTVEKDWLSELVKATSRHPRSAFFQPKIMLSGTDKFNSAGNMIHVAGFGICRGLDQYDRGQYNVEENVSYASGACLLVRRNALREIGICDEIFFMYTDDLDWGWRGKMIGWESTYVPSSVVHHEWSRSLGVSAKKFYYLEFGRIAVLWKNLSSRSVLALLPILVICEAAVLINAFLNGWITEKIRSYAHLLQLSKEIKKRRIELAKLKRVPDKTILETFVTELKHPYLGTAGIGLGKICKIVYYMLQPLL